MPNKTFLSFFWNFVPKNTFFGCKEWTRGELDPPSPQKRQKEANIHFCSQIRWKLTLPLLTPLPFRIWLYSWFTPVTHKQKFSQYFTSRPDPSLKKILQHLWIRAYQNSFHRNLPVHHLWHCSHCQLSGHTIFFRYHLCQNLCKL